MAKKNTTEISKLMKIPYFDEQAAQDYLDIKNGGHLDWSTDENKEKIAKIVAEMEAEFGGSIKFLSALKAAFSIKGDAEKITEISNIIESKLKSTILTDYILKSNSDKNIKKFYKITIYPHPNSYTMYKLFSPYLTIIPKERLPIDMEKLNQAILGERGYFEMVAEEKNESLKHIFRFNINAFRNGYNIADLPKMQLVYYGVHVGDLEIDKLGIDKEFVSSNDEFVVSAEQILGEQKKESNTKCKVFDIVMAGVFCE